MFTAFRLTDSFDEATGSYGILPFSPEQVSGLITWFRPDMGLTESGGLISQWIDQSPSAITITQSDDARKYTYIASAINGQPAMRWISGANRYMSGTVGGSVFNGKFGLHFFTVLKRRDSGTSGYFLWAFPQGSSTPGTYFSLFNNNANDSLYKLDVRSDSATTNATVSAFPYISGDVVVFNGYVDLPAPGNEISIRANNGTETMASNPGTSLQAADNSFWFGREYPTAELGAGNYDMAELLIYDNKLSTTDRSSVMSYLATRYALSF
jgi:hypothetical protein